MGGLQALQGSCHSQSIRCTYARIRPDAWICHCLYLLLRQQPHRLQYDQYCRRHDLRTLTEALPLCTDRVAVQPAPLLCRLQEISRSKPTPLTESLSLSVQSSSIGLAAQTRTTDIDIAIGIEAAQRARCGS